MVNFGGTPFGSVGGTSATGNPAMAGTGSSSGFSFGQTSQAPMGTAQTGKGFFSSPATTTATAGAFGGFGTGGATQPASATSASSGFSFGGSSTNTLSGGSLTIAQPSTSTAAPASATGFAFGQQPAANPAASTSGFSFGSTTPASTASTGLIGGGFGSLATTPAPAPAASSTGFSFSGGLVPGTAVAPAASTGFSFGGLGGTQVSAAPKPSFGFNTMTSASQPAATSTTSSGLGGVSVGLGGIQPPSASTGANNAGSKTDGKSTKEQQIPQDMFATISMFESHRTAELAASEENIREVAAPFHKVNKKAKEVNQLLTKLSSEYLQLHSSVVTLKEEVMKASEHVEMARRTKETPMALQGENKVPEMFVINLVRSFEAEMLYYRSMIEEVSQCLQAASNPCETPNDIGEVLQREHETLKEMASKVYTKHAQLVELSQRLQTKASPNEEEFFRTLCKEDIKVPASAVVRPVLAGSSGLQSFQEQQQRAKSVTLSAAPPTMPLAQATTPSLFGSTPAPSGLFSSGSAFGSSTSGSTSLFGSAPTAFGSSTSALQQTGGFTINSPFTAKPFGS